MRTLAGASSFLKVSSSVTTDLSLKYTALKYLWSGIMLVFIGRENPRCIQPHRNDLERVKHPHLAFAISQTHLSLVAPGVLL